MLNHQQSHLQKHGLTVIVITNSDNLHVADFRMLCEQDITKGDQQLGLGFSGNQVCSIWNGATDELMELRTLYRQEYLLQPTPISIISFGESEDNWLYGFGFNSVTKYVDGKTGLLTVIQVSSGLSPAEAANIGKLREMAKAQGCHVVIYLISQENFAPALLKGMADRLMVIEPCEADPNWDWAVSITQISHGYFSPSRGKLFCQFSHAPGAFPEFVFEPFIDSDPMVRAQWHARKHGATMDEIGKEFDCHKSTVSRNLKCIRKNQNSWLSEDQADTLIASVLGVVPPKAKQSLSPLDDDSDLPDVEYDDSAFRGVDVDDDDDVDLDGLDVEPYLPKRRPKAAKTRW